MGQLDISWEKNKVYLYFTPYTNIHPKSIKNLNVKAKHTMEKVKKVIHIMEENVANHILIKFVSRTKFCNKRQIAKLANRHINLGRRSSRRYENDQEIHEKMLTIIRKLNQIYNEILLNTH